MKRLGRVSCLVVLLGLSGCGGTDWWLSGAVGNKRPGPSVSAPPRSGLHHAWSDENAPARAALSAPVTSKGK